MLAFWIGGACAGQVIPPIPPRPVQPILRGGGGGYPEIDWGPKRVDDSDEIAEVLAIIFPHIL